MKKEKEKGKEGVEREGTKDELLRSNGTGPTGGGGGVGDSSWGDILGVDNDNDGAAVGANVDVGQSANVNANVGTNVATNNEPPPTSNFKPAPMVLREDRKWPKLPARITGWDQLWEVFSQFTPAQWSHFTAYLYRGKPVCIKVGDYKYIDKFNGTSDGIDPNFNYQYIVDNHGGGYYRLDINDGDNGRTMVRAIFDIPYSVAEPKIDYNTLDLTNSDNKAYVMDLKRRGVLAEDGRPMDQVKLEHSTNAASVLSEATNLAMSIMDRANKGQDTSGMMKMFMDMTQALLKQPKGDDTGKVIELVKLVTSLQSSSREGGGMDEATKMFMKSMMDTNQLLMKAMMEQKTQPPPAPPDPWTGMEKMFSFMEKMQEKIQSKGGDEEVTTTTGNRKRTWVDLVETALPTALGVLGNIAQIAMTRPQYPPDFDPQKPLPNHNSADSRVGPAGGSNFAQPVPNTPLLAPPNNGVNNPSNVVTMPSTPGATNPTINAMNVNPQLLMLLKANSTQVVNAILTDMRGEQFAQSLINMFGIMAWNEVSGIGPEGLLALFKGMPEYNLPLQHRWEVTEQFVKEFCGWKEGWDFEDDGDGGEEEEGVTDIKDLKDLVTKEGDNKGA